MIDKQQQLTDFLERVATFPRRHHVQLPWPDDGYGHAYYAVQVQARRPTVEELGTYYAGLAEFQALRLANFLATPNGELIMRAVEALSPPLYEQDEELLVDALIYATNLQHQNQQHAAEKLALAGVAGAVVVAAWITASQHS